MLPSRRSSTIPGIEPGENLREAFINNFPFQLGCQLKRARAALQFATVLHFCVRYIHRRRPNRPWICRLPAAQVPAYRQAQHGNFPERLAVSTQENGVRLSVLLRILCLAGHRVPRLFNLIIDICYIRAYFPFNFACRRAVLSIGGGSVSCFHFSAGARDTEASKVRARFSAKTSQTRSCC